MRLFLAIELAPSVAEALESAIVELRSELPELAWTPMENRHLTLKFIGEVAEDRLGDIIELMDRISREHRPFEMQLAGAGAFPNFPRHGSYGSV